MRARPLEQLMDLHAAAIAYQKVLESSVTIEDTVRILRSLVRISIQLARQSEAREFQNRLLKMNEGDQSADDQLNEARLRRLEGDIAGAGRSLEQVLNLGMNGAEVLELRATLAMDQRDYQAAVTDLQNVLSEQPWNKQAHYKLAQALMKCGKPEEAAHHLSENRRLLEISNKIVSLRMKSNRTKEETEELIRALEASGMKTTAAQLRQRSENQRSE
jgi:predicted Zn-dependent protease